MQSPTDPELREIFTRTRTIAVLGAHTDPVKPAHYVPDYLHGVGYTVYAVNPLFAGNTVFAWSEVLAKVDLPGRSDVGALRLRTIATKDRPCTDFPAKSGDEYDPAVVLDLDYWALMPK